MLVKIIDSQINIINNLNLIDYKNYLCWVKGYFFSQDKFFSNKDAAKYLINNIEVFDSDEKYDSLNGIYSCMLIDKESKETKLITDRIAPLGLYYHLEEKSLAISDDPFSIYENNLNIEVDMVSLVEMLSYRFVTGQYTLFKDIFQVKPASVLRFNFFNMDSITKEENRYWDYAFAPIDEPMELIEKKCSNILNTVMKKFSKVVKDKQVALNLSGGYDSRCILGLMLNNGINKEKLKCFTFGHSESDDISITTMIKDVLNINLEQISNIKNYDKFYDPEFIRSSVKNIGYSCYYFQAFYPQIILQKLENIDFLFTGDVGFTVGLVIKDEIYNIKSNSDLIEMINRKNRENINLSFEQIQSIFSNEKIDFQYMEDKLQERIWETIGHDIKENHIKYFKWDQENRLRKYVLKAHDMFSSKIETFLPFYDYDFIDFMFSIPFQALRNQRVYLNAIHKHIFSHLPKDFSTIKYDKRGQLKLKGNDYILEEKKPSKLVDKFNKIFRYKAYYKYHFKRDHFPIFHIWNVNKQIYLKEIYKLLENDSRVLNYEKIRQLIEKNINNITFLRYGLKNIISIIEFEKIIKKHKKNNLFQSN